MGWFWERGAPNCNVATATFMLVRRGRALWTLKELMILASFRQNSRGYN